VRNLKLNQCRDIQKHLVKMDSLELDNLLQQALMLQFGSFAVLGKVGFLLSSILPRSSLGQGSNA